MGPSHATPSYQRSSGLVDILDRVLDKGLVVAGDIRVSLAEVELLTIRIRLLVCSVDKAQEIGIDWWKHDTNLSGGSKRLQEENAALKERLSLLEERLALLEPPAPVATRALPASASAARAARAPVKKTSKKKTSQKKTSTSSHKSTTRRRNGGGASSHGR